MKKIKFKIEYVPLSDERIERHKDFSKLMGAFTANPKPDWKTRWFGNKFMVYTVGIMTGAAISSLIWWNVNHFSEHKLSAQQDSAKDSGSKTEQVQNDSANGNFSLNNSPENSLAKDQNENATANKDSESGVKNEITSGQKENQNHESKSAKARNQISSAEKKGNEKISSAQNQVNPQQPENNYSKRNEAPSFSSVKNSPDSSGSKTSSPDISERNNQTSSALEPETSSEKNQVLPSGKNSSADSSAQSGSGNISSNQKLQIDTLTLQSVVPESRIDTPLSSLPPDSSRKGIHVSLPKIDLKEELNSSINTISNVADSVGKKIDSLFAKLFEKDSSKAEKPSEEISSSVPPADSFKHRYAQVSFVSPLSTDGVNAKDYTHNLSLNVLQGYNGALDGVEFGGLANIERGYVTGVQFGGLVNFAFGDVKGVQFGGLLNQGRNLKGAQFSGLVSSAVGKVHGAQVAGITNFVLDTFVGLQIGGVINLALANKPSVGWQIAGVTNVSLGDLHGGQLSGVLNIANRFTGTQISLINFSKKITGFQLGLINIADSIHGDALGLFSVSVNGIHNLDVFGSEILYGSVALKLGSPHIYNIFAAGAAPIDTITRIGFGIGLGGHISFNRVFINVDGMSWTIHNNTLRDWNNVNLWNQIRLMAGFQFTKGFAAYAGPTANVQVYHNTYPSIAPYTSYQHIGTTNVDGWVGFVVGLQFF
ncbi:MAG TPA: hypothetical protein VE978_25275 [Chitinophagales bacterium]|nr:hypothetical protein [Chitinophagales bacterium]